LVLLAPVECQLVLRCLDFRSRLAAARCNKQLFVAASQPFAWPQEQLATLRVANDVSALQSLGAGVRGSLLRLSPIHLRVQLEDVSAQLCPEIFAVPRVHGITVHPPTRYAPIAADFLLPLLCHPDAQQMRSLDVDCLFFYRCSSAELEQMQTLPQLHSLSLGWAASDHLATLQPLSLLPSLTHFGLNLSMHWAARLLPSLPLCSRLVSLKLSSSVIHSELVSCLAQLPSLQRLQLRGGDVKEQTVDAWADLRSLHEIQMHHVREAYLLLPTLSSVPMLRLLRWHCGAPEYYTTQHDPYLPTLHSLRPLLTDAPLLQVELVMQRTFDEWHRASSTSTVLGSALANYQRRKWDELHLMQAQLPRVRIVEPDEEE